MKKLKTVVKLKVLNDRNSYSYFILHNCSWACLLLYYQGLFY